MCFSVEIERNLLKLSRRFKAQISLSDEAYFRELQTRAEDKDFVKEALMLKRRPTSLFFKEPKKDGRVFPGYFTDVIVRDQEKRVFKKMRYRLRPAHSIELPSKFNVFNARIDSLETKKTWKNIFMKQHGLFPFVRFFEWVDHNGEKKLINFAPQNRDLMWAPCLWDYWENKEASLGFYSFAIITDDPPPEVSEMGHDRCPVFLKEEHIDQWLSPEGSHKKDIYKILKDREQVKYLNEWAA